MGRRKRVVKRSPATLRAKTGKRGRTGNKIDQLEENMATWEHLLAKHRTEER